MGTFQKAKQGRQQIGNVAARGPNEQVVKLHILLKDMLGLETGCARLAGQPTGCQGACLVPCSLRGASNTLPSPRAGQTRQPLKAWSQ